MTKVKEFAKLREDEVDVLMKAPLYVAILIAGADGNIDMDERKEAIAIANNRQSRSREQLHDYFNAISFDKDFEKLIAMLPSGTEERNIAITRELRKLNFILKKIDRPFAIKLYASLRDLAKKIAESSGGVLSFLTISYEESKLIELKMIQDPSTY